MMVKEDKIILDDKYIYDEIKQVEDNLRKFDEEMKRKLEKGLN